MSETTTRSGARRMPDRNAIIRSREKRYGWLSGTGEIQMIAMTAPRYRQQMSRARPTLSVYKNIQKEDLIPASIIKHIIHD